MMEGAAEWSACRTVCVCVCGFNVGLIHLFETTTGVCVVCLHVCGYSVGNVLQSMCGSLHGSAESAYELPVECVGVYVDLRRFGS